MKESIQVPPYLSLLYDKSESFFLHYFQGWDIHVDVPLHKFFEHCHSVFLPCILKVIVIIQTRWRYNLDLKLLQCLLLVKHTLSASPLSKKVFLYRVDDCKFTENGFIRKPFGKIKLVRIVKPLIGEESFRFANLISFEKRIQSCCSTKNFLISRNSTSPIMQNIKSSAFVINDVSCSLSRILFFIAKSKNK